MTVAATSSESHLQPMAPLGGAAGAAGTVGPPPLDAYAECERVVRASGSSFVHAFRLLPEERRHGLEALYAFCRVVDDAADEGGDGAAALARWRQELGRVSPAGRATRSRSRSPMRCAASRSRHGISKRS